MDEKIERVARAMIEALDPGHVEQALSKPHISQAYFRAARAAIAAMNDWQPIETCPDGTFGLFYEDGAMRMCLYEGGQFKSIDWAVNEFGDLADSKIKVVGAINEPTHWMRLDTLPPPPKP